ncbi:MAG: hypothetical protein R3C18_27790 [Planctomycetaceae bacterium]
MTKRKPTPRIRLYSSEALDLTGLPAKYHDNARLFIHRLIARRIFNRRLKGQSYISMDSRIIRQYITNRHVTPILKYLVESGQLDRTGYSKGNSTRYRMSDELHRSRCVIRPPKSSSVSRKVKEQKERQRKMDDARKRPVHRHLDFWLKRVRIDEKAAMQFVSDNQRDKFSWLSSLAEVPVIAEQLAEDRLHAESSIQAIVLKDFRSKPCRYGRYHTNISCFHKVLRPFLRIDGQPLVEVDVSACQPLCLAVLLHDIKKDILTSVPLTEVQIRLAHTLSIIPVCCASEEEDDTIRYQKDCESGKFYEIMQEICKVDSKSQIKKKLFKDVFFGKRTLAGFRILYPTMAGLIDWVKRHDYRHLSHELQRIESSIVIDDACEVMRVQHPDVPILTIHDAILTTVEHVRLVKDVLRSAFNRRGVNPQIKPEDTPSCVDDSDA